MNPFEMVVLIVLIVTFGRVLSSRNRYRGGTDAKRDRLDGEAAYGAPEPGRDADRLRDEVRTLKERIAVLERIATDGDRNRGLELERQIEALRDGKHV